MVLHEHLSGRLPYDVTGVDGLAAGPRRGRWRHRSPQGNRSTAGGRGRQVPGSGDILSEVAPEQSIGLHARALAESERRHGAVHTKTIGSRRRFAMALLVDPTALQRHHDLLVEVLAQQRATLGSDARLTLATMGVLGDAARRLGRHEEAVSLLREAHERWTAAGGSESPGAVSAALALAEALLDAGMAEPARPLVASSRTAVELMYGDDHPATRRAREFSERLIDAGLAEPEAASGRRGGG